MSFSTMGQAYFVSCPRNLDELLHPTSFVLKHYEVVKDVEIDNMEWDNFVDDMEVEREFLETPSYQSKYIGVFECILVHSPNIHDGVLVVADEAGYIIYAAYCKG